MSNVYIDTSAIREYIDILKKTRDTLLNNVAYVCRKYQSYNWSDNLYEQMKIKFNQYLENLDKFISVLDDSIIQLQNFKTRLDAYYYCLV